MKQISIFTDGAYSTTRKVMGYAYVVLADNKKIHSSFNGEPGGTNNRAEILSVIEALSYIKEGLYKDLIKEVIIYSDSMYVIGTMTQNWKRNTNNDLWNTLDNLKEGILIHWKHVKGHEGDKYNELCDALAVEGSHLKFEENE